MKEEYIKEIQSITTECQNDYNNALTKYGDSLRECRFCTLIDLVYIKILRIKSYEKSQNLEVQDESILDTYKSVINYSVIATLYLNNWFTKYHENEELSLDYESVISNIFKTLTQKNHDYNDAWLRIRIKSMTDIMEVKIFRIVNAQKNDNITDEEFFSIVADALKDIVNYTLLSMVRIKKGI